MDLIKIGRFIQEKRKESNLTQSELAEKLYISDRAVSKWERGVCLPDTEKMPEICKILNITLTDLLSGEKVDMENNEKKLEENLLEMAFSKQEQDKKMLTLEVVMGVLVAIPDIALVLIGAILPMQTWLKYLLIALGVLIILIYAIFALRIEQTAGMYECPECHHKYVPSYKSVFLAMHINRTRYMKCPHCGKRHWQKKVIK